MKPLHHILRLTTFLALVLAYTACTKTDLPSNKKQEVTFSSKTVQKGTKDANTLKSTLKIDYAVVGIGTKLYKIPVYVIDGVIYTTSIKLDPGNYTLTKFLLMSSGQSASD